MIVKKVKRFLRNFYDGNEAFLNTLRRQGAKIGKNVQIVDRQRFLYEPWYANLIEIEDGAVLAAGVRLVSHDSSYANIVGDLPIKYAKIKICKNAYVGVNSIILPGVTIGEQTLIGAGSVVNRDVPPFVVAAGNPVKVIHSLEHGVQKYKEKVELAKNSHDVHFLDLGGSYSQMIDKYGKNITDEILKRYNSYFSGKDI